MPNRTFDAEEIAHNARIAAEVCFFRALKRDLVLWDREIFEIDDLLIPKFREIENDLLLYLQDLERK